MNAMDHQLFESLFIDWVNSLARHESDLISIDGKTSRRSGGADQKPLHLVSAWASERHLVLGQVATDEKSNEMTAGYVIDETRSVEKDHGRLEQRCCRICTEVEWLHLRHPQWEGLAAIIEVTLTVEKRGKLTRLTGAITSVAWR